MIISELPFIIIKIIFQMVLDFESQDEYNNHIINNSNNDISVFGINNNNNEIIQNKMNNYLKNTHEHNFNCIKALLTLSLVCKQWLSIVPTLFFKYIHIATLDQFRELIHLSKYGILCKQRSPLFFYYVNIHLKNNKISSSSNSNNSNNNSPINNLLQMEEVDKLFKEFFKDTNACECLKIHQPSPIQTTDENSNPSSPTGMLPILKCIGDCRSVHNIHIIGRYPFNQISKIPYESLSNIDSLTIEKGVTDATLPPILEQLFLLKNFSSSITYLSLIDNQCDGETLKSLSKVLSQSNCALRELNLSQNYFRDCTSSTTAAVAETTINNNNNNNDEINQFFDSLKDNRSLTTLNLSSNCFGNKSMRELSRALECNHTLTSLDLGNNRISDKGAILLVDTLMSHPDNRIERLVLSGNDLITYQFGEVLSRYLQHASTTNLKYLNISHCILKKSSSQLVQSILANHSLVHLNLNYTNLKKSSLKFLIYNVGTHKTLQDLEILNQHYIIPQSILKHIHSSLNKINIV